MMTREDYLKFHAEFCQKMMDITKKKNADYTGDSGDPFYNFTRVEALGFATTEQGFLTRMLDKFARISTFVQKGVLLVEDESVNDTLGDLSNYCILFAAFLESKRRDKPKLPPVFNPEKDTPDYAIKEQYRKALTGETQVQFGRDE